MFLERDFIIKLTSQGDPSGDNAMTAALKEQEAQAKQTAAALTDAVEAFLVAGGGIMHLLDSVGASRDLRYWCNFHEQACAISAEGYARVTGRPGVCLTVPGPGVTNMISPSTRRAHPIRVTSTQRIGRGTRESQAFSLSMFFIAATSLCSAAGPARGTAAGRPAG